MGERIGFGFNVGTGECGTCLCLGCGGVGGVTVGCHGLGWWGAIPVCVGIICIDGKSRYIYCARWIPAHLRCTQCIILLHHIDICFYSVIVCANQDLLACGYRNWISLDIAHVYEEQYQTSSGSAWPSCPKKR